MYTNQYNQAIEMMKTSNGLAKDYRNYRRCEQVLWPYDRQRAWDCLQDMIREYQSQIEACLPLRVRTTSSNVTPQVYSDDDIRWKIAYIGQRIPIYALMREENKEAAKQLCEWLDRQQALHY